MRATNEAVTTPAASPTAGRTDSPEHLESDATAESSTAPGVNRDASPPSKDAKPATLGDVLAKHLGPTEEESAEKTGQAEESSAEAEADAGEESTGEAESKTADEPDAEAPKETPEVRKSEAQKRIVQLVREKKALQHQLDEIKTYVGGEDGFKGFRELVRLHAEEPAEAVPMLEKLLADARDRAGLVVKSDDIKRKLDDGVIDDDTAVELERSRAEKAWIAQRNQQMVQQSIVAAVDQWEANLRERTPDFDDIADLVLDRVRAMSGERPPATPKEAVAMAQAAYDHVIQRVRKFQPAKERKVQTSSGSTAKAATKPKSIQDILNRYAE